MNLDIGYIKNYMLDFSQKKTFPQGIIWYICWFAVNQLVLFLIAGLFGTNFLGIHTHFVWRGINVVLLIVLFCFFLRSTGEIKNILLRIALLVSAGLAFVFGPLGGLPVLSILTMFFPKDLRNDQNIKIS